MKSPRIRLLTVVAAVFAVGVAAAPGAVAASPHTPNAARNAANARRAALAFVRQAVVNPVQHRKITGASTQAVSTNWSGYAATGTFKKVTAKWTEPSVTCPTNENQLAVFWVGLDGWSDGTVEQDGTIEECYLGTAYHYTWWEMYPTNNIQVVGSSVLPGDQITATVSFASGKYTLKVADATHSANSFTKKETCGTGQTCSNSSAEWIGEAPGGPRGEYPLAQFSTWNVSGAKATSGSTASPISAFTNYQIAMVNFNGSGNYELAAPGSLNGAGTGFADSWLNSY